VSLPGPDDGAPDLFRRSVARLAEGLQRELLSSRGLVEHFLERIERFNPTLNAFTYVSTEARTLADASDRRRRAGRRLGALDGIPVAVKDNLWVQGMPATWGSLLFRDCVAPRDEIAVAKLRASGAIVLGKTNCPEFAMRGVTVNPVFGTTKNPWDLSKTPGGSSGGAVAAVAAGQVPLSHATDGGGSFPPPAANTHQTGVKP
jgi:aspartyl-tRNA(Asn)/glutamyl-tRNA(Gln) amidotransferase subunit A